MAASLHVAPWFAPARRTILALALIGTVAAGAFAWSAFPSVLVEGPNAIRKVTPQGVITTIAGNGQAGFSGDGDSALNASLSQPEGIAVDRRGNVFIAEFNNHRIRKVSPAGIIVTVAGNGTAGFSGDGGLASKASLNITPAVTVDSSGNLYICDRENHRVRKVDRRGIITTVAGNGIEATTENIGDGGVATAASLNRPVGLALDRAGNLYIAERNGHRVRKVTPVGVITTMASTALSASRSAVVAKPFAPVSATVALTASGATSVTP